MNPNKFVFKDWNLFNYYLYIICEDEEVAQDIQKLEMQKEKFDRIFGCSRYSERKSEDKSKGIDNKSFAMEDNSNNKDASRDNNKSKKKIGVESLATDNDEEAKVSLLNGKNHDSESYISSKKKKASKKGKAK